MDAVRLKAQTITEILDSSFRLYRQHFAQFLGVLALMYVPGILLQMLITGSMSEGLVYLTQKAQSEGGRPDPEVAMKLLGTNLAMIVAMLAVTGITVPLATGALTRAVSSHYLNEPTSIGACYAYIFKIFPKYFGTIMLMGLVVGLGFMLCLVPGILFSIWFAVTSSVVVLEGLGGTAALGRSKQLSKDHGWRIVGLWIFILAISLVLGWALGRALVYVVPLLSPSPVRQLVISQGIQQIVTMIFTPFFSVAWVLFYYDLRIRKEGFDLEVLARSMTAPQGFFPPLPKPPAEPGQPA